MLLGVLIYIPYAIGKKQFPITGYIGMHEF